VRCMILGISSVNNNYSSTAVAAVANTQQTGTGSAASTQQIATVTSSPIAGGQQSDDSRAAKYDSSDGKTTNTADTSKQPDKKKAKEIVEQLNNFMGIINTDIKFKLHDKTKEFMVDVVDSKSGKLIRECPSHEFLDMVARLKEYLGALVDKKA
jgi:flagellar protein FlaG